MAKPRAQSSPFVTHLDLGDVHVPVSARVNRRAKRLIVRVDSIQGVVTVVAPSHNAVPAAIKFAKERAEWIRKELRAGPQARPFVPGTVFPFRGARVPILAQRPGRARVALCDTGHGQALHVDPVAGSVNELVIGWLRAQARQRLVAQSQLYAARLNRSFSRVRITDTRSRWGSCSETGTMSYNWRLIMTPDWVLDYVVAHECAHLCHMNHSSAFWACVDQLGVDADTARAWFRSEGAALFSWGLSLPAERDSVAHQS